MFNNSTVSIMEDFDTLFEYFDGKLFNKVSRGSVKAGEEAGYIAEDGYRRVCVSGKYHYIHKIVYFLNFGEIPDGYVVDHIDRNKLNNNLDNLRLATKRQNQFNKTRQKNGTSVYKGVWYDSVKGYWKASIRLEGKRVYIGQFNTETEAAIAYDQMAIKEHGEFANLNILDIGDA
jgi:hypothetical protein